MNEIEKKISKVRDEIKKNALIFNHQQRIVDNRGNEAQWIFDLRNVFLKPEFLDMVADIFWSLFEKEYPFQVGGQETAAIPFISAIVLKSHLIKKPVNGFFIRKSRKPIGLQKIIEGCINDEKIILVDDLINTCTTVFRQAKVLDAVGRKVDTYFSLVNFHGDKNIEKLSEKKIKLVSLFGLSDFDISYGQKKRDALEEGFDEIWKFKSPRPQYHQRQTKCTPCLDKDKIYYGNDSGYFWALNQSDGTVAWKFKTGYDFQKKYIYSSPVIYKNWVYFGAYDGNVYALDKETGKLRWKNMDSDYIGSSPAISQDLKMLFISCQYGLFKRKGGALLALDIETGKKKWEYAIPALTESSPACYKDKKNVVVGSNNGFVYLLDAENGKLRWKFRTNGPVKSSFTFDQERNLVLFGSYDKCLYALDIDSGEIKGKFETREIIYSTPVIFGRNVFLTSLDKNMYSLNLESGKLNWRFEAGGRIFSSPRIYENYIYFGSTDGRMYEIDSENKKKSYFQTLERITDDIVFNPQTQRFFLATYANEIYCLVKKPRIN
jgi:outer membrane protein assembly factor BamB